MYFVESILQRCSFQVGERWGRGGRAYYGDVLILETHFLLDNQLVTEYPMTNGVLDMLLLER